MEKSREEKMKNIFNNNSNENLNTYRNVCKVLSDENEISIDISHDSNKQLAILNENNNDCTMMTITIIPDKVKVF